jgi:hypothetical protein
MTNNIPTFFSRRQVAALFDTSEDEVKKMDNTVFNPSKGPDGSLRYSAETVVQALKASSDAPGEANTPGAVCALAFELFQTGKSLPDVVISLKQSPETVSVLRAKFDAMAGGLILPSETVSLLRKVSGRTVGNASDVLKLIDSLCAERDAAYDQGFADASDTGEVLDPQTGKMTSVASIISRSPK